jgi:hypothetical protein
MMMMDPSMRDMYMSDPMMQEYQRQMNAAQMFKGQQ